MVGFRAPGRGNDYPPLSVAFLVAWTHSIQHQDRSHRGTGVGVRRGGNRREPPGQGRTWSRPSSRPGHDHTTSVVDSKLNIQDHRNLFICDAGVFVTPGGARPQQTIMALAVRRARLDRTRIRAANRPANRPAAAP